MSSWHSFHHFGCERIGRSIFNLSEQVHFDPWSARGREMERERERIMGLRKTKREARERWKEKNERNELQNGISLESHGRLGREVSYVVCILCRIFCWFTYGVNQIFVNRVNQLIFLSIFKPIHKKDFIYVVNLFRVSITFVNI